MIRLPYVHLSLCLVLTTMILPSTASRAADDAQVWHQVVATDFGDRSVLTWQAVNGLPTPGEGEVRIRVLAASASFTDIMVRKGLYAEISEKPPLVPGYDLVGVIDAVGPGVTGFKTGQRVADLTVWGAYTEYAIRPVAHLVPLPDGVDPVDAVSLILSYTTAYQMLHRVADVQPDQRILVHGASGAVGSALTQLARLDGIEVFGTASARKHDYVRALGADPIDYRSEDFVVEIGVRTAASGVHAAFDAISLENFRRSYDTLTDDGILVTYGLYRSSLESEAGSMWSMAREFIGFQWQKLMWQWFGTADRRVQFYSITQMREAQPAWFREDLEALFKLLDDGKIDPQVWRVMPLQQAAEAHRLIEDGEVRGKIVLRVSD
jgi:NADPH:quinone reductase-like Zn-dependent oxidoreductase